MAELFNFVTGNPWGAFLGGAICVIGIIGLLAVVLNQRIEAERKQQKAARKQQEAERLEAEHQKQEAERLEAERQKQEVERLEAERKKQEAERLEAERKKQEAERLEAERKKQEAERLEAERKKQEAEPLEAERKKQEAERLEAERQKQEAERLEAERKKQVAERKQQVAERKAKAELTPQEINKYWNFAKTEYGKFKAHNGDDDADRAVRREIAMRILKLTNSYFTKTELDKQYQLMHGTYVFPLHKSAEERFSSWKVLKTAYDELCGSAI